VRSLNLRTLLLRDNGERTLLVSCTLCLRAQRGNVPSTFVSSPVTFAIARRIKRAHKGNATKEEVFVEGFRVPCCQCEIDSNEQITTNNEQLTMEIINTKMTIQILQS